MNKRGNIGSIVFVIGIIVLVAILSLFAVKLGTNILTKVGDTSLVQNNAKASSSVTTMRTMIPALLNTLLFVLFAFTFIGLIFTSLYTDFSPTIFFVFLILLGIAVIIANFGGQIYTNFSTTSALSDASSSLPVASFLLSKYTAAILFVIGIIVMIILYGKRRQEGTL